MRTIVIGDIHGCYKELKSLIATLEKNRKYDKKKDRLIFLGDYIDRGSDSRKVIGFIKDLQKHNKNVIALMGNHEDMFLNYLNEFDNSWTYNGYETTLESYKGYTKYLRKDVEWMENLPLYYEDEHFIYVHAGIDYDKTMDEQDKQTLLWIREPFIYNYAKYDKRVIFGHTPTFSLNGRGMPIYTYNNNVGIDTGCVFDGALTALIIVDDKIEGFYQQEKIIEKNKVKKYKNATNCKKQLSI